MSPERTHPSADQAERRPRDREVPPARQDDADAGPDGRLDLVDEALRETFPASDPPATRTHDPAAGPGPAR